MRRYAALGLAVDISEMDVASGPGPRAPRRSRRGVYREVATACLDLPACGRFTTWGFTDASTWLGTGAATAPVHGRRRPQAGVAGDPFLRWGG